MLNSPLAAATRARVYHQRTRQRPRERGLRAFAAVAALLVHLLFLFGFVLGPAFQVGPPPASKQQFLQVRLIEPPEPPPPPPVRGTPPKERGPRHQGHSSQPAPSAERSANMQTVAAAKPAPASVPPVLAKATKTRASTAKPVAAPPPPVSLPQPAPTPELQPIPLASEPPAVTLPTPTLQPPVPPKFQPESVRKPQLEGTQPLPPPPSLALPEVPVPSSPPISVSSIALNADVPKTSAPASVTLARAQVPVAPPVPELQPVPLPAQPSPSVTLQTQLTAPAPTVPIEKPQLQAPKIEVTEAELEAVPLAPAAPAKIEPPAPAVKIDVADTAQKTAIQPSIERPQLSAPTTTATAAASMSSPSSSPAATEQPAAHETTPSPADASRGRDVSSAPDATPQGSDTATPGQPNGVVAAPDSTGNHIAAAQPKPGQGHDKGSAGKQQGVGQPGGNRPGADQGNADQGGQQGVPGSYVQLKPRGDTQIMNHGAPNIGYQPTRFEQDWAPEGESSIDTALRHAVEKTTVKHTFHLPRGVRVECAVIPLLPMSLFGCKNPDPPAKPVDAKVYERLHLAPANPLASPAPAASSASPAPMVKLDNGAECAAARVAGSPPPPSCIGIVLPVKLPAPSSSSWVPASDQFH
ncbi:MAG TPA: hypothetical protein VGV14_14075 [Rhodanobacter sp.]|nr:hypothetical protein [Rhodanobacter sp.]